MKILIIDTTVFGYNGIANVILNYYKAMDKTNMQIDIVMINEPEKSIREEFEKNNSKIYVLEERNTKTFAYLKKLKNILKEQKYDIMHVHGNSATLAIEMLAGLLSGIKVRIAHSHNTTSSHMKAHILLKPVFKMTYTHGFACGKDAGKWLFGKRKFVVINNGIDDEKFKYKEDSREEIRKKLDLEDKFVLGHVGGFNFQKNHDALIDIFYEVQKKRENAYLILIGDGDLKKSIERKVKKMKIDDKVKFVGLTTKVDKYMQAMDVFLLPSRYEGLPLVLVEAQAAALQCVVSDNVSEESNIANLVKFVPVEDKEKFVKEILEVDIKDTTRKNISKKVNVVLKEKGYSIKENAKKMRRLYADMIL